MDVTGYGRIHKATLYLLSIAIQDGDRLTLSVDREMGKTVAAEGLEDDDQNRENDHGGDEGT